MFGVCFMHAGEKALSDVLVTKPNDIEFSSADMSSHFLFLSVSWLWISRICFESRISDFGFHCGYAALCPPPSSSGITDAVVTFTELSLLFRQTYIPALFVLAYVSHEMVINSELYISL